MKYTYNEYGQLEEHPDYYAEPAPEWVDDFCGANPLLADCWEAYDKYCEPYLSGDFDPEYDALPDFDAFVAEWFEKHVEKAIDYYAACRRDAGNEIDTNSDYWAALAESYAAYLKESWRSQLATVEQYKNYYDSWYLKGMHKHAA